jgi:hypothetical protein
MANKDDQILALLVDLRNHLGSLDARLRNVEEAVEWLRSDMGTLGGWVQEINRRS